MKPGEETKGGNMNEPWRNYMVRYRFNNSEDWKTAMFDDPWEARIFIFGNRREGFDYFVYRMALVDCCKFLDGDNFSLIGYERKEVSLD